MEEYMITADVSNSTATSSAAAAAGGSSNGTASNFALELKPASQMSDDEKLAREMQLKFDLDAAQEAAEREAKKAKKKALKRAAKNNSDIQQIESGGIPKSLSVEHMLFVACEIEGKLIEMLVDSGASISAISYKMVKKLGLKKKLNSSVEGSASGIGSVDVKGILENVACSIGHVEFRLFFLVLDSDDPWLILGLDQMRRFKCLIDLDDYNLVFGGKGGVSVPFLEPEVAAAAIAKKLGPYSPSGDYYAQEQQQAYNNATAATANTAHEQSATRRWGKGVTSLFGRRGSA